jgi:hypothetical protein
MAKKIDEPAALLPDGGTLRYREDVQYPPWIEQEQPDEENIQNRALYAALAHAHYALSTLRRATISFPPGTTPARMMTGGPTPKRFGLELALLDAALEVCGVERGSSIPLPKVEAKPK